MNIIVDCGMNKGKDMAMLLSKYGNDDFKYYGFDPLLQHFFPLDSGMGSSFHFSDAAVSTFDGERNFNITEDNLEGSSFYSNLKDCCAKTTKKVVKCINFSQWVKDNINKDDYVILKMTVEGEEYNILPEMIKDGTLSYVDDAYIRFESPEVMPEIKDKITKDKLIEEIKKIVTNITVLRT